MGKILKDGVKNIYCSTCEKWMTEFYVSRHIHSKSHFTNRLFQSEKLQKTLKLNVSKKSSSSQKQAKGNQMKSARVKGTEYEQYRIHADTITKCNYAEGSDALESGPSSVLPDVGRLQGTHEHVSQNEKVIQPEATDNNSLREYCKTPDNVQEYKVQGDTLKKMQTRAHQHSSRGM